MNELISQLHQVPADLWYAVFIILGASVCALIVEGVTATNALKGLVIGVFGGALIVLITTNYFPHFRIRVMCAIAGVAGLLGNFVVHLIYDRKTALGGLLDWYLKSKLPDSPRNPSKEDTP